MPIFKKTIFLFLVILLLSMFSMNLAMAACDGQTSTDGTVKLCNPLNNDTKSDGIPTLLGKIIKSVLGIVGSLALVMFIYGGIVWMTSSGNQEQITRGKNILIWTTVGLAIIFTSYALVNFIIGAF